MMMAECEEGRGLPGALLELYPAARTLEQFCGEVVFADGARGAALVQDGDTRRFRALVTATLVCAQTPPRHAPRRAQLGTLSEVLAFVLNHMKKKKKRNVLTFGYRYSERRGDPDPLKFHGAISQSAALIAGSELWKKINERLGSELTKYLLQDCAIFTTAPPSCLVQLCGVPVYDLLPVSTWSGFFLSSCLPGIHGGTRRLCARHFRKKNPGPANKKKRKREDVGEEGKCAERPAKKKCVKVAEHEESLSAARGMSRVGADSVGLTVPSSAPREGVFSWKTSDQPPHRPSHCSIRVLNMLYCGHGMKAFPLNRRVREGVSRARRMQGADLVRMIFLQGAAQPAPHRLPRRFFKAVPLFSLLLQQHRRCPYDRFLRRKCSTREGQDDMAFLLASHCSSYRVYLFVRECLRHVVPEELWGSRHNLLRFLCSVKRLLRLGRFERLSLAQVTWKMRVSDCHWLGHKKRHCPSEQRYREWIWGQLVVWLLHDFVQGLVKSVFYVTETMGHKHTLRFYRRDVWIKLQRLAFRDHLSKGQWQVLSPAQASSLPKTTLTSRIRFIPKTNGMRPITRLIGTGTTLQQFQSSVRDLQNVLGVCVRERPSLLGSTVWGRHDIHRVLSSITHTHKHTPQPLYFVKVDISGAYDSLPHAKLMEVVRAVLEPVLHQRFFIRHYAKVWSDSTGRLRRQFCTKADAFESLNMKGFAMEEQSSGKLHDAILVEKYSTEVKGSDVFHFFEQMLSSYVIKHEQKLYQQVCGVPQGSAVSTMLCNLCYGHMENSVLKDITESGGCLLRLVDDFLFITPRMSKAVHFLQTLLAGVPDYGCQINPQKVAVNFPVCDELSFPEISELPPHCLFPWCGLLIDTHTLDVYNDYSGYAGLSLRYSLTLGSTHSAARFMRQKLLTILRLKCDSIFLDLKINSVEAVYRNTYKIILLQALRFHVCVQSLPLGQNVNTNPNFFMRIIWSTAKITNKSIRHTNTVCEGALDSGLLQCEAVELLCCLAFEAVLTRHRPSYTCLLPHIHTRRRRLQRALCGIRLARVYQAASPRIPFDFRRIHV